MKITKEVFTIGEAFYNCMLSCEPETIRTADDVANAVNDLKEVFLQFLKYLRVI